MKNFGCPKCGSIDIFLKESGSQTGLYCGDCGKWIKWVSKNEIPLVKRFIEENRQTIEQDSNVISNEQDIFKSLCKQMVNYLQDNYNVMTSVIISADSQIKIIEDIEEIKID